MEQEKLSVFAFERPLRNLILFITLCFIINVWVSYHLSKVSWMAVFLNLIPVFLGVFSTVKGLFSDQEAVAYKQRLRQVFRFFLHPLFLGLLIALVVGVGNFASSVTVYADGVPADLKFRITAEGEQPGKFTRKVGKNNGVVSSLLMSNPFGKSYFIEVEGYLRKSFELYPWVGKRIKIERDLAPSPSLYLRLPGHFSQFQNGTMKILLDGDTVETIKMGQDENASILLGKKKVTPAAWKEVWNNNLALSPVPIPPGLKEQIIAGWQNYQHQKLTFSLLPEQEIDVLFFNHIDRLILREKLVITKESFQDYLIRDIE